MPSVRSGARLDAWGGCAASAFADRVPPALNRVCCGSDPTEPMEEAHPEGIQDRNANPSPHVVDDMPPPLGWASVPE
jgi:hypothetical protein